MEDNKDKLLAVQPPESYGLFELIVKANLQLRNIQQAKFWLDQRKKPGVDTTETMYLESVILGLEAKYIDARALLEKVNQATPMVIHVPLSLYRCEQMRAIRCRSL